MQLDSGVIRPCKAASAQAAGRHVKIAAILLNHDIGGNLGGTKEGVLALVDGEVLGNAMLVGWIGIVPAGLEFFQSDGIGTIAIDLIRGHVDEGRLWAGTACRLQEIQGADRIGVKVIKGNRCGPVMARLGSCMDNGIRTNFSDEVDYSLTIADIDLVVNKTWKF